jgi:hypothetical protein
MLITHPPSALSSVLIYAIYYLGLAILVNIVLWTAETYTNLVLQPSSLAWMPPFLAAMQAGQRYGQRAQSKPSRGQMWLLSFWFVMVSLGLSLALIWGLMGFYGVEMTTMMTAIREDLASAGLSLGAMAAILAGVAALLCILLRFAFGFGVKTGIKTSVAKASGPSGTV